MQYEQIVFLLFIIMALYDAAMIFMDIQRAKAAQNAEQDSHKEEDIDISEEARSFRPIRINRDEPESKEENQEENNTGTVSYTHLDVYKRQTRVGILISCASSSLFCGGLRQGLP